MQLTRRGFLALLAAAPLAAALPLPTPAAPLFVGQNALATDLGGWPVITQRKLMARIRITEEAMEDSLRPGAFQDAWQREFDHTLRSWQGIDERDLLDQGRGALLTTLP